MSISKSLIPGIIGSLAFLFVCAAPSPAQITINIPKFPKIKKEKPQPTPQSTETRSDSSSSSTSTSTTAKSSEEPANVRDCKSDPVAQSHLKDLAETQAEAEEFRPGLRGYYVSTLSDRKNLYLEAALLPGERKAWLSKWPTEFVNCMNTALDGLAAVAKRTLPTYTGPSDYTLGTPADKKALLSGINDIATAKVLKAGMKEANWLIEKDSYNFPTSRYKHGVVWAQYPTGMCWIFWINVVQDYAGGGTYGASYGNYVGRSLAGCPAGK